MARPTHPQARLIRTGLTALLFVAAASGPVGCRATSAPQGRTGIDASFSGRTLTADLAGAVPVQAVFAAAQAALRARGYTVTTASATADHARVNAATPRSGALDQLVVRARQVDQATRVEITVEPFGDETRSRAVLDGILESLGR